MSPILIRCTVHRELSHEAFADWLDRRRAELTRGPGGLRHVNACRLGASTWVLELHTARPDDSSFETAANHLLADLALLGLRPDVYVEAAHAPHVSGAARDRDGAGVLAASAPYAGSA